MWLLTNKNKITSTLEQFFGDNDQLSVSVAHAIKADLLVRFSDIDGYCNKNPQEHNDAKIYKILNELPKDSIKDDASPNDSFAIVWNSYKAYGYKLYAKK